MPDLAPSTCPKRRAFDALAPRWDSLKPDEAVAAGARRGLSLLGELSGRDVVDLGCGTGDLLLSRENASRPFPQAGDPEEEGRLARADGPFEERLLPGVKDGGDGRR